ncbi:MAG: hypothetical protein AAF960_03085 [Bacteroidota bacterium]
MKRFVFDDEQKYQLFLTVWTSVGFHFATKRDSFCPHLTFVYLLETSGN